MSEYERGRRDGLLLGRLAAIDAIQSRMVLSADQYKIWRAYRTEIEQRLAPLDAPAFLSGLGDETVAEFDAQELATTSGTPAPPQPTNFATIQGPITSDTFTVGPDGLEQAEEKTMEKQDWRSDDRKDQAPNVYLDEGVYCQCCEKIVAWRLVEMPPTKEHAGYAKDLLCGECAYILATFHEDMAGHLTPSQLLDYRSDIRTLAATSGTSAPTRHGRITGTAIPENFCESPATPPADETLPASGTEGRGDV
jgi:hypothetical protein